MEAEKLSAVKSVIKKKSKKAFDAISERRTPEQVIALCGSVGSGLPDIAIAIEGCFKGFGYTVYKVKASDLILESIETLTEKGTINKGEFKLKDWSSEAGRISSLQAMGDRLRKDFGNDVVSQLFIKKISTDRQSEITAEEAEKGAFHKETRRVVWIIDSLKHPEEVKLLRLVYDKMFSLFGVLCTNDTKVFNLVEQMGISNEEANSLIETDKSEDFSHGQKLTKTLHLSDFFVRNAHYKMIRVQQSIERFVKVLIGDHAITPRSDEYAMFLAQSAAYRSGCMSRQVGAAIIDKNGNVISTGFNDVPKAGGGLYNEESSPDARCFSVSGKKCKNDQKKADIKKKIVLFSKKDNPSFSLSNKQVDELFAVSGLSDLTEYCRAVHAEMDAITGAARKGTSVRQATMFVTTFPCHNCAKHIIASGIMTVYYIEPYEKSLALALHEDAVSTDTGDGVKFLPFEGVSPRQYQNRFSAKTEKKKSGKYVTVNLIENTPTYSQLLDSFAEYEGKVVDCLDENGL